MPLALPALTVALSLILTWLVLYGMHQGSNTWLRTLLDEYTKPRGSFVRRAATAPARLAIRGVIRVEQVVRAAMAAALAATSLAVAQWLTALSALSYGVAHEIEDLGVGIEEGLQRLVEIWIPRYFHKAIAGTKQLAEDGYNLGLRARAGLKSETQRRVRGIDDLGKRFEGKLAKTAKGIEAGILAKVAPRLGTLERFLARFRNATLPGLLAGLAALEKLYRGTIGRRLSKLEKATTFGALSAVVVRVLAKRFPWMFCRKLPRVATALCGTSDLALNLLTGILLGTLALRDFQATVRVIQNLEHEAAVELIKLMGALDKPGDPWKG